MRRVGLLISAVTVAVMAGGVSTASGATAGATVDAAALPSDAVTAKVVTMNGSGCPAGTASVRANSDNTGFAVTYNQYVATAGAEADNVDFRKNCQLAVQLGIPSGFTYAIARADYSGWGHLATGATGLQRANYYFQGASSNSFSDHKFTGPFSGRWQASDETDMAEMVYAPCGETRFLNINTELRVNDGSADPKTTSALSMRYASGSVSTIYNLSWKQCP
jgi:hypothetical protein